MSRPVPPAANALITRDEGLVLHAYRDPAGTLTIGYGHTGPDVRPGEVVTAEFAAALEARDAAAVAAVVERLIGAAPTDDGQFGAMVSLAFNIGDGNFARSTVLREHGAGNWPAAADAFLLWDEIHGAVWPGLRRRRQEERAMYLGEDP